MLYFLRMAGAYIENIWIDTRTRWSSPLQHRLITQLNKLIDDNPQNKKALENMRRKNPVGEFVFDEAFGLMLAHLDPAQKENLTRRMAWEHGLPWNYDRFHEAVTFLRTYRHKIDHADKLDKRGEDATALQYLGLLLLPHFHTHLLGRMKHHLRRMGRRLQEADAAETLLRQMRHDRLAHSKELFGLATRKTTKKNERKDRVTSNDRWKARFPEWFAETTHPRYREHEFKTRYHFIGASRLKDLEQALAESPSQAGERTAAGRADFICELEPLYYATLDINLVLHAALTNAEEQGITFRDRKFREKHHISQNVVQLRNQIAHGDFFWRTQSVVPKGSSETSITLALQDIFKAVFDLAGVANKIRLQKEWRNNVATAITAILKAYGATRVHFLNMDVDRINETPPPLVIHRWTAAKQKKYLKKKDQYRIDKRPRLRAILATWQRALAAAGK